MKCVAFVLLVVIFVENTVEVQSRTRQPLARNRATSRHLSRGRDLRSEAVWTTWSGWTPCSFTCDRGVRSRYRGCVQRTSRGLVRQADDRCPGKPRQYQMCEEKPCPLGSGTPKEYQCAQKNKVKVLDKYYEWIPLYIGSNQCDLTCMASGHAFYNNFGHASDGTPCGTKHTLRRTPNADENERVCINGTCLAVGCDGMVDSGTRLDKCRVCGGENANCYHFRNSYMILEAPEKDHEQYQDMVVIPEGATYVEVTDHSNNYLALADDKGTFILNGNWMIDWPGKYEVDDTVINYERRSRAEILTIEGPTTRKLILKLLFRERNPGVHYEFYIPSTKIDDIIVPEAHFKNKKSPTYIPPALRPPRYGTESGSERNETERKVVDNEGGSSVARTPPTPTPTPTPTPRRRGVEIPLSKVIDEQGNLVETTSEKPLDDDNVAPPGDHHVDGGLPWYLKARRSDEFDDLVGGGIPLAKRNDDHAASASSLELGAQAPGYGQPLYHWPPLTRPGYGDPYSPLGGAIGAGRMIGAGWPNAGPNGAGLFSGSAATNLLASGRSAGFLYRNPFSVLPPGGGGQMTPNWDQFALYPYGRPPLTSGILPLGNPAESRRLFRNEIRNGAVPPLTAIQTNDNGTWPHVIDLYPKNRNPVMPLSSEPNFGAPRNSGRQLPRTSGSRQRTSGHLAPGLNDVGWSETRRTPGHSVAPKRQQPSADQRQNVNRSPLTDPGLPRSSGRETSPQRNARERTLSRDAAHDLDVPRDPKRGFIQPPRAAPMPPSYRKPVDDRRARLRSGASPVVGVHSGRPAARGYVLGDGRRSYLDYYKDLGGRRQSAEQLNSANRLVVRPFVDVMAHDSGIADDGPEVEADAFGVPDLDADIKGTLEITPQGERVILYDLTDVFKDDVGQQAEKKVAPDGRSNEDGRLLTEEDDGKQDRIEEEIGHNRHSNDDYEDNEISDDDDDDDDDDDYDYHQNVIRGNEDDAYSNNGNVKVGGADIEHENTIEKKRDQHIFDYINEIIENGRDHGGPAATMTGIELGIDYDLESVATETSDVNNGTASSDIEMASVNVTTAETTTLASTQSTAAVTTPPTPAVTSPPNPAVTTQPEGTALTTQPRPAVITLSTPAVLFSMGSKMAKLHKCPKCARSRNMVNSFCKSDIALRATVHSSRLIGAETRYKVTIGEFYRRTPETVDERFIWINNTCRCPRLRKHAAYLLMGDSSNGRIVLNEKSYARKFKPSMKRKLDRLIDYCSV